MSSSVACNSVGKSPCSTDSKKMVDPLENLPTDVWRHFGNLFHFRTLHLLSRVSKSLNFKVWSSIDRIIFNGRAPESCLQLDVLTILQHLDIAGCFHMTNVGVRNLTRLTQLRSLDVSHCNKLTDDALSSIGHLTSLVSLKLSGMGQTLYVTDQGMAHLRFLTELRLLDLANCRQIGDNGLLTVTRNHACLQALNLFRSDISHVGLIHLTKLNFLSDLNIGACFEVKKFDSIRFLSRLVSLNLSEHSFNAELLVLTSLSSLSVINCSANRTLDLETVKLFKFFNPSTRLILTNCHNINPQDNPYFFLDFDQNKLS